MQLGVGLGVMWIIIFDKEDAVNVVWFLDVSHETAIDDQPPDSRTLGQIKQPAEGLDFNLADFSFLTEACKDFISRR